MGRKAACGTARRPQGRGEGAISEGKEEAEGMNLLRIAGFPRSCSEGQPELNLSPC
jgi:hypothetical protein